MTRTAPPVTKTRKQQSRSKVTQDKLLDAALIAFSESGYEGTSTRDIAERAGVHHPLITYHFSSKEALWKKAVSRAFDRCFGELRQELKKVDQKDTQVRVEVFFKTFVRYASHNPALHRIVVQESSHPNPRIKWISKNYLQPMYDLAKKDFEELQASGIAPAGNIAILFNMIRMTGGAMFALSDEIKMTTKIDLTSPEIIEEVTTMLTNIFLPGRKR